VQQIDNAFPATLTAILAPAWPAAALTLYKVKE
jgi:hypothetical protein